MDKLDTVHPGSASDKQFLPRSRQVFLKGHRIFEDRLLVLGAPEVSILEAVDPGRWSQDETNSAFITKVFAIVCCVKQCLLLNHLRICQTGQTSLGLTSLVNTCDQVSMFSSSCGCDKRRGFNSSVTGRQRQTPTPQSLDRKTVEWHCTAPKLDADAISIGV